MRGIVVKGIAGFYYVKADGNVYQCKARGIFKKDGIKVAVGDIVNIELNEGSDALITEIDPRKNSFIRPPIVNVDCMAVVFAAAEPDPSFPVIDKFLVMAEKSNTEIIICVNKVDLADDDKLKKIRDIYDGLYPMVFVSGAMGTGIEELKKLLEGKKCALAGPSGVGKSTILNALEPEAAVETGQISGKTKRGKHTTRHVEIFETDFGAMIFDTPGFTSFDVLEAEEDELAHYYPEMHKFLGKCRYDNCRHIKEPECAVREAVKEGEISKSRYRSYEEQINEIRERSRKW